MAKGMTIQDQFDADPRFNGPGGLVAFAKALGITKSHAHDIRTARYAPSQRLIDQMRELWPDLDEDMVRLSCGRFPEWAEDLARRQPQRVLEALKRVLEDTSRA